MLKGYEFHLSGDEIDRLNALKRPEQLKNAQGVVQQKSFSPLSE